MKRSNKIVHSLAKSPILWGALASAGFYVLIHWELLCGAFVQRYFASHPVEYATTVMFFVGLAALVLKGLDMLGQYAGLAQSPFDSIPRTPMTADGCSVLLTQLGRLPQIRQNDYLVRRLREAVEHVRQRGSAESLDEQLKYLAEVDADRQQADSALVRVIIWAIPILGFLGTVIGLTLAIAQLTPEALENSLPEVIAGLGVAFDTTALALGLSIVLMFTKYYIDQRESKLLDQVDQRAAAELEGRFVRISSGPDGHLLAVRQMAETVLQSTEDLVRRQAELWRVSIESANQRWATMTERASEQLQTALAGALSVSLKTHARELAAVEEAAEQRSRHHWDGIQQTQVQNTQALASLGAALVRQTEMLDRTVEATGQVARLEDTLNKNLASLAGTKNFEQTVISLAATIHLLNARLAQGPAGVPPVNLEPNSPDTQAA